MTDEERAQLATLAELLESRSKAAQKAAERARLPFDRGMAKGVRDAYRDVAELLRAFLKGEG